MNRRTFSLMASTSLLAFSAINKAAIADTPDASLLNGSLTPFGAERAGNVAGTIPAWTGGLTEIPADSGWDPDKTLPPDFFASDAMLYKVDASNLHQYADVLCAGVQTLIRTKGFYLNVYPTRRTHALPRWIYDNIALNVARARAQAAGEYRLGFTNAYGGIPFPIPSRDPRQAGAQLLWNHEARYTGSYQRYNVCGLVVQGGPPVMSSAQFNIFRYDYYLPKGDPTTFDNRFYSNQTQVFAPANVQGTDYVGYTSSNPLVYPIVAWESLPGQGRVRRTPNLQYDTPSAFVDGISDYDEIFGFNGALDRYDWKLVGKKEMLIPYNNNKIFGLRIADVHKPNFVNPEAVRWELHRVWQVQASLHKGSRNTIASRTVYLDEDTSFIALADNYDAAGNLLRHHQNVNANFPNLPSTIYQNTFTYAMQTGDYVTQNGSYADPPLNMAYSFKPFPDSLVDPQAMAAAAAY